MTFRSRTVVAVAGLFFALPAQAGAPSVEECFEGSDFVANAARGRDNGIARESFLARMEGDFVLIRSYPLSLRWFVKDETDEAFLRKAVLDVFDAPRAPESHHASFLDACLSRAAI